MTSSIEEINLSKEANDDKKPKSTEDPDSSDLIVCQLCPLTFSRQCNYKRHLEVAHSVVEDPLRTEPQGIQKKVKHFDCTRCSRTFLRQSNLYRHLETHNIFQTYKKDTPDRSSPDQFDSSQPREGEEQKDLFCSICNRNFFYETALEKHKELHLTKQATFSCSHCSQKFFQKTNLVQHEYTHTRPVHSCVICKKSFNKVIHLKTHLKSHRESASMCCDKCGKTFKSKVSLELHLKNHITSSKFKCNGCDAEFSNKSTFLKHMQLKITNSMRYRCAFCGKICCHKKNLDFHLTTHSIGSLTFKCEKCNELFSDKVTFQIHLNSHLNELCCPNCKENFPSEDALFSHTKSSDGSPVKCPNCSQPVPCRTALTTHLCVRKSTFMDSYSEVLLEAASYETPTAKAKHRDHTYALQSWPIKPYKCKKCGRHFCRLVNLEKHIQEIHPFYLSAESSEENSDEISDDECVRASKQVVMPRIASVTSLKMENERIFVSNNFQDQVVEEEEEPVDPLSIDNEQNHNETEMQIGNVRSLRNVIKIEPRLLEDGMSHYISPRITEVNLLDIKQEAIEYESS